MLDNVCKILSTMGCANKLIKILTVLRITVFVGAFAYTATMLFSLLKQNIKSGA